MSEKVYFLSSQGTHVGPYTKKVVLERIKSNLTTWVDYVYDEEVGEWQVLLEHADFSTDYKPQLKQANQEAPSVSPKGTEAREWYILKDGNNFGPYSVFNIVKFLQERSVFEYDFIWNPSMSGWKKISEVPEFTPENIRKMKDSGVVGLSEVFFRRRHARAKYGASLIVHNNQKVFKGKSIEVSVGGAGVIIEAAELDVGQTLYLHFKPGEGVPPFNAICQVVSKQQLRNIPHGPQTPVKYGVKFTSISQVSREQIREYTDVKAA